MNHRRHHRQLVAAGARGRGMVPVLRDTGRAGLVYAAGLALGLVIGR